MSADVAPTGPLTEVESSTLARYEQVIADGLTTFVSVGTALTRIRDNVLYRATHDTFEAYCRERWSMSRSRAYQLIDTATTVRELSTMVDTPIPANERQAREVADLPVETAAQVMQAAAETGPITAASIARARQDIAPKAAKVTTTEKVERHVDLDTGEIVADPYAAGVAAADAVVLPRLPRDYERERLVKQNGNLAHALETFAGMADPVARARYAREWDPDACDAYPRHFTPDNIRDVANGLLAFADELESSRGLRVV